LFNQELKGTLFFTPFPTFPHGGRRFFAFPPWGKMKGGFSIRKGVGFTTTVIKYYLAFGTGVKRYCRFSYLYMN